MLRTFGRWFLVGFTAVEASSIIIKYKHTIIRQGKRQTNLTFSPSGLTACLLFYTSNTAQSHELKQEFIPNVFLLAILLGVILSGATRPELVEGSAVEGSV